MATLVLTVVGSAIGGPIGGAIGAALGQRIDNALFAPKSREGARLKELDVQISSYGSQLPAHFGTMRVAGTVIWATDLVERRAKSGGGKGRPSTVNFSYSVSIAVALSSRPIVRVGRIWADGNLLRGAAGDLKVETQLRIYTGHEDQAPDPLMASAEGPENCPAHRGIAYALFEDLQLADFGNRIPSLTFELFERDSDVPVAEIFHVATGGAVTGESAQTMRGFALAGSTARAPLALLEESFSMECRVRGGVLCISDAPILPVPADPIISVHSENNVAFEKPRQTIEPASRLPHIMTLRYYDRERDFQTSLQRSARGRFSAIERSIELPAVLDAAVAKQLVENRLLDMQSRRHIWRGDIIENGAQFCCGDHFVDETGGIWQIIEIERRFGSTQITARASVKHSDQIESTASPGRLVSSPDVSVGETRIVVVELPAAGLTDPGKPGIAVFAAGTSAGWRRAALSLGNAGAQTDIGSTAQPATIGTTIDPLPPHVPHLIDEGSSLRVQMLNISMDIANRSGSPLDEDAPIVWLSGEFIRYGNCEDLGHGIYRFSRLLRGCFGLDDSIVPHPASAPFVLISPESARLIDERTFATGDDVQVEALGLGDVSPARASAHIKAHAITPLAPVHGALRWTADGGLLARWVRRSRIDNGWKDGVDQVMAEEREHYRVMLFVDDSPIGEWIVDTPQFSLGSSQSLGLALAEAGHIRAEIRQLGRFAQSAPLVIFLP
jgi:hypothetical protein